MSTINISQKEHPQKTMKMYLYRDGKPSIGSNNKNNKVFLAGRKLG
jgi:hypothetical protein